MDRVAGDRSGFQTKGSADIKPLIITTKLVNDGRTPVAHLEEVTLPVENAVVELTNEATGELIYSFRVRGTTFAAPVHSLDKHTLKARVNRSDTVLLPEAIGDYLSLSFDNPQFIFAGPTSG